MFKTICALCVTALFSQITLADDGGLIAISVKDIQMSKTDYDTKAQKNVTTPVPVSEMNYYSITANGGEAAKLMRILPPSLSVITAQYPKFAKAYDANFRVLEISGAKGQPAVIIGCDGGTLEFPSNANKPPTIKPFADGAHCTITVTGFNPDEGDIQYSFNPVKNLCGK